MPVILRMNLLIQDLVLIPEEIRVKCSKITNLTMTLPREKKLLITTPISIT